MDATVLLIVHNSFVQVGLHPRVVCGIIRSMTNQDLAASAKSVVTFCQAGMLGRFFSGKEEEKRRASSRETQSAKAPSSV